MQTKAYWMDKPIEELTREELIEVILSLGRDLDDARNATKSIVKINELARKARERRSCQL